MKFRLFETQDDAREFFSLHYVPEELFEPGLLEEWAEKNGYIKFETQNAEPAEGMEPLQRPASA